MKTNQEIFTALRFKVATGTPSLTFQTLAEPSVEVETKNSESRLKDYGTLLNRSFQVLNV